jgi:DNA sulfur modification protein DndD
MRISLSGWASTGLRCPDVEIDLVGAKKKPAKVALIQMPNGTGKTTTLELLKATLTGRADSWPEDKVRSYRRHGDAAAKGRFRVTLLMDDRPLTIELTLDFENGTAGYRTTTPGSGGVVSIWKPPGPMRNFLTPEFLNLFIFDGEFADQLLERDAGRADKAIDALCQLYLLEHVGAVADRKWKSKTTQGGPTTASGLDKHHQQLVAYVKRKEDLTKARELAERKADEIGTIIAELTAKIADRLSSVEATQTHHNAAQLALQAATAAVDRTAADVMSGLRMPLALHPVFAGALLELKENLDHLKLPENTSAQFFVDLCEEPDCICGRPMSDVARAEIIKRSKGYLDAEESGTINALKHDITTFIAGPRDSSAHDRLQTSVAALATAKREQRQAEQTLRALAKELIDGGDEALKEWQKSLEQNKTQQAEFKSMLLKIDAINESEDADPVWSLKLLERKLNEVRDKIAAITKTVKLKNQTAAIHSILERTVTLARERIRNELVVESNARLETVLANDPLRISHIDKSLHLAHQGGASVGQKLSVGYTFLMSALNRGNNEFPLVVDSPANPIDEGVRRNVGKLIPELCTQFVGFTINTERAGFVTALERASDDCLFLTMFRKTPGTQRLMQNLPDSGVVETDNAILVRDREYFMSFDVTREED